MKKRSLSLSASFGLALGSVLALALLPLAPVSRIQPLRRPIELK